MRQSTEAFGIGMHALFAIGILVLSLFTLYLAVASSLSGCCLEYRELHSSGESVVCTQCPARQVIHVMRQSWLFFLDELYTISTSKWTRILVFFSVLTQNGEVCSADASIHSLDMRCSHLEIWNYFFEAHVAGTGRGDV